jgi:hypothetical protein
MQQLTDIDLLSADVDLLYPQWLSLLEPQSLGPADGARGARVRGIVAVESPRQVRRSARATPVMPRKKKPPPRTGQFGGARLAADQPDLASEHQPDLASEPHIANSVGNISWADNQKAASERQVATLAHDKGAAGNSIVETSYRQEERRAALDAARVREAAELQAATARAATDAAAVAEAESRTVRAHERWVRLGASLVVRSRARRWWFRLLVRWVARSVDCLLRVVDVPAMPDVDVSPDRATRHVQPTARLGRLGRALYAEAGGPGGWPPGARLQSPSAELDGRGDDDTDDAVADTLGDMFKSMVIDGSAPRRPSADVRDEAIDLLHSLMVSLGCLLFWSSAPAAVGHTGMEHYGLYIKYWPAPNPTKSIWNLTLFEHITCLSPLLHPLTRRLSASVFLVLHFYGERCA